MLSDERIAEIQARLDAATPRPWSSAEGTHGECVACCPHYEDFGHRAPSGWQQVVGPPGSGTRPKGNAFANAAFIENAPTDVADLLAENAELRHRIDPHLKDGSP